MFLLIIASLILPLQTSFAVGKQGDKLYYETLIRYQTLTTSSFEQNNSEAWIKIAKDFHQIYEDHPNSSRAEDTLFLSGRIYEEIGNRFHFRDDYFRAIELSKKFVERFPNSALADDALIRIARITEIYSKSDAYREYQKIIRDYPGGDMFYAANNKVNDLKPYKDSPFKSQNTEGYNNTPGKPTALTTIGKAPAIEKPTQPLFQSSDRNLTQVTKIRKWSTPDFTRVVIELDKERPFKSHMLKADPSLDAPPRLYVDIEGTTVDPNLTLPTLDKGLLRSIKFARNTPDKVRVVLYISSFKNFKVFPLYNPYRIVMDINGTAPPTNVVTRPPHLPARPPVFTHPGGTHETPPGIMEVLGLKIKTVVIDAGHGGNDPGAIGPSGVKEKDVNLKIALALKKKLQANKRIERVILTRSTDRFIRLEERTAIAQKNRADLFISIHCNSSKNRKAYGIETYILSFTENPESLAVAARENATNARGASELRDIIKKYVLSSKINESHSLAHKVQNSLIRTLSNNYSKIKNKGVKKAPFVVLIGADVPSILVETSFISNSREEKRLISNRYIDRVATAISDGVIKYSNSTQTAYLTR